MTHLDVSNYDFDTFDVACLKADGVTSITLGCQQPNIAEAMAKRAIAGNLEIRDTYGFDYFGGEDGSDAHLGDVADAVWIGQKYARTSRVWIDVELDANKAGWSLLPSPTPERRIEEVAACETYIRQHGMEPGYYGAPWFHVPQLANTKRFAHLPLWLANYGANDGTMPPIRELGFLSFGGWTTVAVHQYTSTLMVCGRGRDANYLFEEDDMADPRVDKLIAALTGIRGEAALDGWIEAGNDLLAGYAAEQAKLAEHIENHRMGVGGTPIAPHTHVAGGVSP